jgi:hypothetical protein
MTLRATLECDLPGKFIGAYQDDGSRAEAVVRARGRTTPPTLDPHVT